MTSVLRTGFFLHGGKSVVVMKVAERDRQLLVVHVQGDMPYSLGELAPGTTQRDVKIRARKHAERVAELARALVRRENIAGGRRGAKW